MTGGETVSNFKVKMKYLFFLPFLLSFNVRMKPGSDTFDRQVSAVLSRIRPPQFPAYSVRVGAGEISRSGDFQKAVNQAIETCHRNKGGKVVIPPGDYLCDGPIRMLSNVHLHLEKGAVIRFGTNPADYLPMVKVRWEGTVCYNYSPLVYAAGQQNIAVTGEGVLDGQADRFWFAWKKQPDGQDQEADKKILRKMGETGIPENERKFGEGHRLRPTLLEFFECENILLEGFTARQSPFWTIHPVFSRNITIRNLRIGHGTTNDDGIDPDSCEDVLIEHCRIDTHDDAIAIKSGRDQDAWSRPGARNTVIRHCILRTGIANGVCVGSEMSGGVESVWVDSCTVETADHGVNVKANLDRGGFVRDMWVRNLTIDTCRTAAIRMQTDYHGYRGGNFPPDFDRITFQDIRVVKARDYGWWLSGVAGKPIGKVTMHRVRIEQSGKGNRAEFAGVLIKE